MSQDQNEPVEPVDEAARLEARRKRREAIRAKYRSQATPLRLQALQLGQETDSSSPSVDTGTMDNTESRESLLLPCRMVLMCARYRFSAAITVPNP